ncbi:PQQ-binding-like beta-propeller repeat protein [Actinoplanes sp. CA-015351]|uniref:PQQ-binding-like beta-propeller repeat protein n=1 Tax=Actinoplanes sp. CA-015351 TaxID=3239897 RepID=UPI003D99FE84
MSLVIAAGAAASPATAAPAPGWEHPGFDAEDSHYNPAESVINAGSVGRLAKKWSVRLRDVPESCSGWSPPLVAGGQVIVTDKLGISAYGADSGAVRWRFDWNWPSDNSTPTLAVSGGLLIAANGDCNSQSGQLTALNLADGKVHWKLPLDVPIRSAVVDQGVVVISGWSQSDEELVAGFRASDGRRLWDKPGWSSSGVSANGVILMRKTDGFGAADGGTSAISVRDGVLRWSRLENWVAEAAFDGSFYVTDQQRNLIAVDETDGSVHWTAKGKASALIAVDGQRVYRSSGRVVEAVDGQTGRRVWKTPMAVEAGQPVRAGGLLYAGGQVLAAFNGNVPGPTFGGHVVVSGGRLYQVNERRLTAYAP